MRAATTMRALLCAALFASAGCLSIHPDNGGWSCGNNGSCPSGYSCIQPQNVCWRDGTPPPPAPDMAVPVDPGPGNGGNGPTIVPSADHSSFTLAADAPPLVANGRATATAIVTLKDASDTPAFGIHVSFDTGSDRDHFAPPDGSSATDGTMQASMTSEVGGDKMVTAHVTWDGGGFDLTAPITFAALPAATNSRLTLAVPRLAADGAASTKINVLVKDGNGAAVANAAVKLSVVELSGGSAGAQNKLTQDANSTDAAGSVTGALASTLATNKRVYADIAFANDPSQSFTLSSDITFDPVPSTASSAVTVTGNDIPADGTSTGSIKVSVRDGNGTPVAGAKVQLSADDGQTTITQNSDTTNTDGEITATATSVAAGDKTITAMLSWSVDGVPGSFKLTAPQKLTFHALPSTTNSRLTFSAQNVLANGGDPVTATITVRDFGNAPVAGVWVTLAADDAFTPITQPTTATNSSGVTTATIRATKDGTKKITASLSATASISGNLTFAPVSVNRLAFSTQPPSMIGRSLGTVSVQAFDGSEVLITTVPVPITMTIAAADGKPLTGVTLGGTLMLNTTPASGTANFNDLTVDATDLPRTFTLTASGTLGGVTRTQASSQFTVQANALPPPTLTLTVDGSDIVLSWTSVGADSYAVERKAPGDAAFGPATTVVSTGATSARDPALKRGTYAYHVKATKAGVQPSVSADVSGAPGTEVCFTHWDSSTKTGSIFVYAFKSDGTTKLMRTVSGATTGMNYPWGIAYRAATDELYVVNYLADAGATDYSRMNVFARTATNATPSTIAPVRSLKLHNVSAGTIPGAQHIALSAAAAQLIVAFNEPPYAVVAYPIGATNDDAAAWWIQGGGTGVNLQRPSAVTVEDVSASDYRVFVGTGGTQPNTVYGFESMNVNKTSHDVVGSVINSMLNTPAGLSIDPVNHELFVANRSSNAIAVFNSISMANSPKRALLSGAATGLSTPVAVGFESNGLDGNIHVLNANNHSITKYSSQYTGNTGPDSTVSGLPSGSLNGITVCN